MKTITLLLSTLLVASPIVASAHEQLHMIGELKYMLTYGMLQSAFAKELCSCRFVEGLTLEQCEAHMGLPEEALDFVAVSENAAGEIIARPTSSLSFPYAASAIATFHSENPRLGCRLTYGMVDALEAQSPAH